MNLRLAHKLIRVIALAACCLQGGSAAWAAGRCMIIKIVEPNTVPHNGGKCPKPSELNASLSGASDFVMQMHYQDAEGILEPLTEMNCDARASLLLAAALEGQGEEVKATAVLQRAHSAWPLDNSIAASLAREYLLVHEPDKAIKALNHFQATPSTRPEEMRMAVIAYLAENKLSLALDMSQNAYKYHPSLDALLLLANVLQLEGRYPVVLDILNSKRKEYADSPKFFITLAESEYDAKQYASANKDIERAIDLDDSAFQSYYIFGNILARRGDLDHAIAEYRESLRLNPNVARTYYHLALVMRMKTDAAGEESILRQALAVDDHYAPAHCELGRLLLDQSHIEEAVNHLNVAVEINPRSEKAYYLLARAYTRLGEVDKARAIVNRLMVVKKENQPAATNKMTDDAASRLADVP